MEKDNKDTSDRAQDEPGSTLNSNVEKDIAFNVNDSHVITIESADAKVTS